MEWTVTIEKEVVNTNLKVSAGKIGKDILICLEGGNVPHIGCVVQAVPRPSLKENGSMSTTASVLNLTGHKDEFLCRKLAEEICSATGCVIVCTGGFHLDGIKKEQIEDVIQAVDEVCVELSKKIK